MNIRDIIAIRDRLKRELDITEKFLAIARRSDISDSLEPMIRTNDTAQQVLRPIEQQTAGDYGSVTQNVMEAIKLCPIEFSVQHVFDAATKDNKTVSKLQISTVLARLKKSKKVEVVTEKKGKSPAVYRKK